MQLNFLDVTDRLTGKQANLLTRVAMKLNVSEQAVRQARVRPGKYSGIRPPAGWEQAVLAVAREYLAEYAEFIQRLEREIE